MEPKGNDMTELEALARAYDKEDSAQRGEPSPWDIAPDDAEWRAERLACAKVAIEALNAARLSRPSTAEAVAWQKPNWMIKDAGRYSTHSEALDDICAAARLSTLSYDEAIAIYLRARGLLKDDASTMADPVPANWPDPSPQGGEEPTPTPNSRATQYPNVPLGETGGTDELVERLNGTAFNDPEAWRAALLAEAASSLAAEKLKVAELTDLYEKIVASHAKKSDIIFERTTRAETAEKSLSKSEQRVAALVGARETIRVEALEEVAGLAIPAYSYDVAGVRTGIERFRKQLQAYAAKARAALASEA